jgi:hypothetical protein
MSQGVMVFKSLAEALRNGFSVYDKLIGPNNEPRGYIVRQKTAAGWALAEVRFRDD